MKILLSDDDDVEDDNDSDDDDDDDGDDHGDDGDSGGGGGGEDKDDDGSEEGTGYFSVETAIRRKKPPSESDMELDLSMNKQPQSESDKDMNLEPLNISSTQTHSESETDLVDEGNLQPMTSKKRKRIDEASSLHEPQLKQQKTGSDHELISKRKEGSFEVRQTKTKCCQEPKIKVSHYHYETHPTKIQILILKAYKKIFSDIKTWKENFTLQREATEDDLQIKNEMATKRKQVRTALELLNL